MYYYENRKHGGLLELKQPLDKEKEKDWKRLTDEEYDEAYRIAWNERLKFGY